MFPTYKQQRNFQDTPDEETDEQTSAEPSVAELDEIAEIVQPEDDEERKARWELERERQQAQDERRQQKPTQDTLCPRFRKIPCQAIGNLFLQETADGRWEINQSELEQALDAEVKRVQEVIFEDNERLRSKGSDLDGQVKVSSIALTSER